ncbi:hypothetical protein AAY473_001179 [Plecturocebus cupreus]
MTGVKEEKKGENAKDAVSPSIMHLITQKRGHTLVSSTLPRKRQCVSKMNVLGLLLDKMIERILLAGTEEKSGCTTWLDLLKSGRGSSEPTEETPGRNTVCFLQGYSMTEGAEGLGALTLNLNCYALFWDVGVRALHVQGKEHKRLALSIPQGVQVRPCSPRTGLTVTLEPLPCQSPQQGPTVLTEGRALVIVDFKSMWHVNLESLLVELKERQKLGGRCQVTVPDKLVADRAKCGLWEEGGGELVALDMVDLCLLDGTPALMQSKEAFRLKFTHVLCVYRKRMGKKVKFCHRTIPVPAGSGGEGDGQGTREDQRRVPAVTFQELRVGRKDNRCGKCQNRDIQRMLQDHGNEETIPAKAGGAKPWRMRGENARFGDQNIHGKEGANERRVLLKAYRGKLECSGTILVHYICEVMGSSDPPAQAAGTAGMCDHTQSFTLSPRLQYSGKITAHCNLDPLGSGDPPTSASQVVETGFHHVGQAGLELLTSGELTALAFQNTFHMYHAPSAKADEQLREVVLVFTHGASEVEADCKPATRAARKYFKLDETSLFCHSAKTLERAKVGFLIRQQQPSSSLGGRGEQITRDQKFDTILANMLSASCCDARPHLLLRLHPSPHTPQRTCFISCSSNSASPLLIHRINLIRWGRGRVDFLLDGKGPLLKDGAPTKVA